MQAEELAAFQATLLEVLDRDVETIQAQLQDNPAFAPFQEYINTFDESAIEVAAELVKKWGRRYQ
ncbi:MAG: hypothetical protein MUD14_05795 [Hydrococcus sp. Prado102]|jgi:hypothetical protein|nr:hypothetical protein [Hydrococcus sp. Prado102]